MPKIENEKEQTIKIKVCKEDGTFGYVDITVPTEYDARRNNLRRWTNGFLT